MMSTAASKASSSTQQSGQRTFRDRTTEQRARHATDTGVDHDHDFSKASVFLCFLMELYEKEKAREHCIWDWSDKLRLSLSLVDWA